MPHRQITRPRLVFLTCLLIALGLFALVIAAPWLAAHEHPLLAALIYQAFSPLCHQTPSRSFVLEGAPFAVCARCTGVYLGLAIGIMSYPVWRRIETQTMPSRVWLLIGLAPLALDGASGAIGIFSSPPGVRALTGVLAGAVLASFMLPGFVSILMSKQLQATEAER